MIIDYNVWNQNIAKLSLISIELYHYEEAQSDVHFCVADATHLTYIFIGPPLTNFFIWIHHYVFLYLHKYVLKLKLIISLKQLSGVTH